MVLSSANPAWLTHLLWGLQKNRTRIVPGFSILFSERLEIDAGRADILMSKLFLDPREGLALIEPF